VVLVVVVVVVVVVVEIAADVLNMMIVGTSSESERPALTTEHCQSTKKCGCFCLPTPPYYSNEQTGLYMPGSLTCTIAKISHPAY
jgi:hypothetical protein